MGVFVCVYLMYVYLMYVCLCLIGHNRLLLTIGRDSIRVLQQLGKTNEFAPVWNQLRSQSATSNTSTSPSSSSSSSNISISSSSASSTSSNSSSSSGMALDYGLSAPQGAAPTTVSLFELVIDKPTPSAYIESRVTPEMEKYLLFLLKEVAMGNQRRYQTWFVNKFMSAPEAESLFSDLARYICVCHHPTNEELSKNFVSRWSLLGWLFKLRQTPASKGYCVRYQNQTVNQRVCALCVYI